MARIEGISIHTTLAGGDPSCTGRTHLCLYFNPHHPRGWRHGGQNFGKTENEYFNPHHPRGWRQKRKVRLKTYQIFQSTPPSRVATFPALYRCFALAISIHTTLAGGDILKCLGRTNLDHFNPHHPRGWRLALPRLVMPFSLEFQSTPPSRVATDFRFILRVNVLISIHTTLAGGDRMLTLIPRSTKSHFNPHHPRGWRPEARIYAATRL